jgi:hypothetical protein
MIDQAMFQMAVQQHVTVSPAEVDARIAELRAGNALPVLSAAKLRNHVTAQIAWKKMGQRLPAPAPQITPQFPQP